MVIFFILCFWCFAIGAIISEVRELIFYRNNGWDFDLDSGTKMRVYYGDSDAKQDEVPNKRRVLFHKPFDALLILVLAITFTVTYWFDMGQ